MDLVKQYLKQYDYICFILSISILPLSIKISSKLLLIAIILGLIKSIYNKDFKWFINQKPIIIFNILFIAYIIIQGLMLYGFTVFFKTFDRAYAPYLIFLFVPLFYKEERIVKQIPLALIAGVSALFFLITLNSLIELHWYNREKVLEVFDIHHLYISLYILFIINYLFSESSKFKIKNKVILLFVLLLFLILFKSKSANVIAIILLLYHIIISTKPTFKLIAGLTLIVGLLILIFNAFFYELYMGALDFRSRIWEVATDSIVQKPIFGYGSSSEYSTLNMGHFLNGNYDFLDSNLNSHNQFLTFLLKFGIIGLVLVFLPFFYLIFKMNSSLKKEYFGFLILMFCMSFIESLFNRHHGVVFFCIMIYYYNTLANNEMKQSS